MLSSAQRSASNCFVAVGLARMAERRDDTTWVTEQWQAPGSRCVVVAADGRVLVDEAGHLQAMEPAQVQSRWPRAQVSFLGVAEARAWFGVRLQADDGAGVPAASLRALAEGLDAFHAGLCAYACALAIWQAATRYCPACAAPLRLQAAGHRAACSNPACGRLQFPRIDPAIIVIVEHAGACLLGRQASWPEGRFSTLAGFVEPGEALADAVRREVFEEAGVEVLDCDFHSSQPWPFPASLMFGFHARAAGREIRLHDGELTEARWFTPADIEREVRAGTLRLSSPISVSWHLLDDWMRGQGHPGLRALACR